jgi:hypothetical protein
MQITLTLSEAQERGLGFACDKANTERRNMLPESKREKFVPETPEDYAVRIFGGALDSYEEQRVAAMEQEKLEAFRKMSPEDQQKVLAQFATAS